MVFTNGSAATASSTPGFGAESSSGLSATTSPDVLTIASTAAHNDDEVHTQLLRKTRAITANLQRTPINRASADANNFPNSTRILFTPAIGVTKTWVDNAVTPTVNHQATVVATCTLATGRTVVWWTDNTIVPSIFSTTTGLTDAVNKMKNAYCGTATTPGGLSQLTTLLGDVWGSAAAQYNDLIHETAATPQDINVVILNVPASVGWAGYFFSINNILKTSQSTSNEALAFFINAAALQQDSNFITSTLMHESTHMLNFYQRSVARGFDHDTWSEETSAMMTEDIITPTLSGLNGYNKMFSYRIPSYMSTGGNVSYINWPDLSGPNYAVGGSFGAFLNRRYGLAIYTQLIAGCQDGVSGNAALTSYDCLDKLIKQNGGIGFSDEFARMGATVFAQMSGATAPAGYGYPSYSTTVNGLTYNLQAFDLSTISLASPAALTAGYQATSHTYQRTFSAAGSNTYVRNNIVVPPNTSLKVVIK